MFVNPGMFINRGMALNKGMIVSKGRVMRVLCGRWWACCLGLAALAAAGCGEKGGSEKKLTFDEQLRKAAAQSAADVRAREFVRIAGEQFQAKDVGGAMQTVKRAHRAADEVADLSTRVSVCCFAAETLARVGQSDAAAEFVAKAISAAENIQDLETRARQLARIAQAQARFAPQMASVSIEEAEKLAAEVEDLYGRVLVLAMVGRSYDALGRTEEGQRVFASAVEYAGTIEDAQRRTMALAEVAVQQALGKRQAESEKTFKDAMKHCQQVEPALARVHALADIAQKLSRAGSPDRAHKLLIEAEKLSASIAEPDAQTEALLLIRSLMAKLPRQ